ncbi:MAG: ATP-dependent DNA helicase [Halobacteria archaeon]|nr:ATP-dependent DNA helicase [Halobacteria archaeon]
MEINDLPLPKEVIDHYHEKDIESLYPPQKAAVNAGVTKGKNLVAAVPTASGKTLIAEISMLSSKGKSLYIVPLRALASEKYNEFSDLPGVSVGISTGDYDSRDDYLAKHDIIVATSEKVDSLIRNGVSWIDELECIVVDEVHLLDSSDRGPTLEVTIAKLRKLNPNLQVIALSATIANPDEIAGWLDASLIETDWRPVDLRKGVYEDGIIEFDNDEVREVKGSGKPTSILVNDSVEEGGQCLVFVNSRRNAEALAKRLSNEGIAEVPDIARRIEDVAETDTGRSLANCVFNGVAFHHAGLRSQHRSLVEDGFRNRDIKIICATPTLAAGVNVPARRVIVRDTQRYSDLGMEPIPVLEVHQMFGRAGRPHLDPYGEAILIAKSANKEDLWEEYIEGEPEAVYSKLANQTALRTHILSTVASGFAGSRSDLLSFLEETFYSYQESEADLGGIVGSVIGYLETEDMIETEGDTLEATDLGHQVSRLYIDPMSASEIVDVIEGAEEKRDEDVTALTFLEAVCDTPDMYPFYLRKGDEQKLYNFVTKHEREFVDPPSEFERGFESWLASVKTARVLHDWINEVDEDTISERHGVGPGDIRSKVERADWLLYAADSLARLLDSPVVKEIQKTRKRISNGVSEDLLDLVSVKGIGRVRARRLYEAGIESKSDLRSARPQRLANLLGPKTAVNVLNEVGLDIDEDEIDKKNLSTTDETRQSSIGDF